MLTGFIDLLNGRVFLSSILKIEKELIIIFVFAPI